MRARAFAAAVALLTSPGGAQTLPEPPLEAPPEVGALTPTRRVWYGWQTLIVAGASTAAVVAVDETASRAFWGVAFVAGGAAVHWLHGHSARGFATIGIDLGLGFVGAGVGALIGESADGSNPTFGALAGLSVGLGLALVIDVAALAYDDVPAPDARPSEAWMTPTLRLARGGGLLGIAGHF